MNIRIQFRSSTIKTLVDALHKAYEQDSLPMVKRIQPYWQSLDVIRWIRKRSQEMTDIHTSFLKLG